jgi:putative ABC transport system substrate-binding protein
MSLPVSPLMTDPFVENLGHPGGNVTGFTHFGETTATKWLELLREIAPGVARTRRRSSGFTGGLAGDHAAG